MSDIVFVNGRFCPKEEAVISVFDRGFIFGDGVYEVVPVVSGAMVDKDYFIQRLARSLGELKIAWPCESQALLTTLDSLINRNAIDEGMVYVQVTRGVAEREFGFPKEGSPTLMAYAKSTAFLDSPEARDGIAVMSTPDLRWKRRDIKSVNLLGQVLAKQDAIERGGKEGWMVEDGYVTEGVSSSAYIVKDGVIITRPLSNEILPGIRRRTLLELCADEGIQLDQRRFTLQEAFAADEAFISSATTIVHPVVSLDSQPIGNGEPGPITRKLRARYLERLHAEARNG